MKITLKRRYLGDTYTIGSLYIDGEYFCDTLEDVVRDVDRSGRFDNGEAKIAGRTAIPYGTYRVVVNYSPKFKRNLPRLLNVPSFVGVLFHRGRTASDSSGCILVGENKVKGMVINSTYYELKLVEILTAAQDRNEPITLDII